MSCTLYMSSESVYHWEEDLSSGSLAIHNKQTLRQESKATSECRNRTLTQLCILDKPRSLQAPVSPPVRGVGAELAGPSRYGACDHRNLHTNSRGTTHFPEWGVQRAFDRKNRTWLQVKDTDFNTGLCNSDCQYSFISVTLLSKQASGQKTQVIFLKMFYKAAKVNYSRDSENKYRKTSYWTIPHLLQSQPSLLVHNVSCLLIDEDTQIILHRENTKMGSGCQGRTLPVICIPNTNNSWVRRDLRKCHQNLNFSLLCFM